MDHINYVTLLSLLAPEQKASRRYSSVILACFVVLKVMLAQNRHMAVGRNGDIAEDAVAESHIS